MSKDSLFEPLANAGVPATAFVEVIFNGERMRVPNGSSVAAALLAGGIKRFRKSPVSGDARAPYCMMGVCFECLLEIDGIPNRQGCLVSIESGMKICTQDTLPEQACDGNNLALSLAQSMEVPHGK